jgi:sulfate adenylyltransferase large subunit
MSHAPSPKDDRALHLATCGSVDDGKSTLIGRLLFDAGAVLDDQLAHVATATRRRGLEGVDLSLLTDGLRAEREQGITIDVAWRTFRSAARRFSLADSPGHVQYTCNMAVAASSADIAIVLLDATRGVVAQTRRHVLLSRLVGVGTFVVCINKMDAVGFSDTRFAEVREHVVATIDELARLLPGPTPEVVVVPISALGGDNVVHPSGKMPWYDGVPLLTVLERSRARERSTEGRGRLAVQWVTRPADARLRAYAGRVTGGPLHEGDAVGVFPEGHASRIATLTTARGRTASARAGESVTVTLDDAISVSRGDVIAHAERPPRVATSVTADVVVLARRGLVPGAPLVVKQGTRRVRARITRVEARYDLDALTKVASPSGPFAQNDVLTIALETQSPLVFDPFSESRATGSLILVDPTTGDTLAAGGLHEGQISP